MNPIPVLDLFSAAAGGWSLGMHRAGFTTMAACEAIEWRRILYAQNNPDVRIYDDVRTLTADRLLRDFGYLPAIIVGSPPCQDISSANTKGKGVKGERSGLFFEAIRIIGECRPRWFALENSANLRTRGADAVLAALEDLRYASWPLVVRASDIGANHERPRSWIIGCDPGQIATPANFGHSESFGCSPWPGNDESSRRKEDRREPADLSAYPHSDSKYAQSFDGKMAELSGLGCNRQPRETPDPDEAGQADGRLVTGLRQTEIADDGCGDGRSTDRPGLRQMGLCAPDCGCTEGAWPLWSLDDLAARIRLDARIPARVAGTRIAFSGGRGTSAASLIVEAYGDSVVPQIPEAIGRAFLRTEAALSAIYGRQGA